MSKRDVERTEHTEQQHIEPFMLPNEEFAADFAYADPDTYRDSERGRHFTSLHETRAEGSNAVGWTAVVFSIAAWFIWPVLMSAAALGLAIYAFRNESRKISTAAIIISSATLVIQLLVLPLYFLFITG